MTELITIKSKSKTGQVIDIQVQEILEIDGQPYRPTGDVTALAQLVNHLSGRIAAIEAIVGGNSGE
jgi:hypothetical protein